MLSRRSIGAFSSKWIKPNNIRFLQTTPACLNQVGSSKKKRPVTVDREFPDPFASKKQNRRYFWTYGIAVTLACAIIFNYEKTGSPIVNSTLYFLRRSSIAQEHLGDEINFSSSWPWIWGTLNTVKGDIDIQFSVKGSKNVGTLKLKATRDSKLHPFDLHHFILEVDNTEFDLAKDPSVEFDI